LTTPCLIDIAGLSGSGKTALAHSHEHLTLEQRAALNFDHPDSLDWPLLQQHLAALHAGRPIDGPVYLFDRHTRSAQTRRIEPRPFLIVEGILTFHRPQIRSQLNLKLFVETRPEECLRRRIERDVAERGRTRESVLAQYQATVWPMALKYVLPSRVFADLVVSGEEPLDHSVATILARVSGNVMTA
jgi:uridine kinase